VDSYIRRKRWEWREQAVASLNAQAEAMGAGKGKRNGMVTAGPARSNEVVFRPNNGGINYGPPPLGELAKLGFDVEM
jgi:hypothetical protein